MRFRRSASRRPGEVSAFDRRMVAVASVTVLGTFMSILDTTIVTVAIPTFVRVFHTSLASVQWVTTGYLLSLAVVVPMARWTADRFGTKRVWMVSLTFFLTGSLLCGLSWSLVSLICFRVLQGLGGGMIMPVGQMILVRESGPDRLGRVMTVVGVPALVAPLIGPVIGGLILSSVTWRWIFFINLPIGLVAMAMSRRILHAGDTGPGSRLDVRGLLLLPPGMGLLVYGISEYGNVGRFDLPVDFGLGVGVLLLAAFTWHALRSTHPLLDLRLWKNRSLAASTSIVFLFGSGINAAIFLVQIYYQLARGASPLRASMLVAPAALGAMIALPLAGQIMDRYGSRRIVPFGLVVISAAVIPFTQLQPNTSEILLSACWFVRGLGVGAAITPATAAAYTTLRRDQVGGATTINNIIQRLGASLGVAFAAAALQRRLVSFLPGGSVEDLTKLTALQLHRDGPVIAHAFADLFWYTIVLTALALIPAMFLPARHVPMAITPEMPELE